MGHIDSSVSLSEQENPSLAPLWLPPFRAHTVFSGKIVFFSTMMATSTMQYVAVTACPQWCTAFTVRVLRVRSAQR